MKRILLNSSCLTLFFLTNQSFAAANPSLTEQVSTVRAEARELRDEVRALRAELRSLRLEKQQAQQTYRKKSRRVSSTANLPAPQEPTISAATPPQTSTLPGVAVPPLPGKPTKGPDLPPNLTSNELAHPTGKINKPEYLQAREYARSQGLKYRYYGPERYLRGITVTTSPYLGMRSALDASDLLYQYPAINEDLKLLTVRNDFEKQLQSVGDTLDNRAIIAFSGALEGQIVAGKTYAKKQFGDINLSNFELDISAMVSSWANAFAALNFDDNSPQTGSRVTNSRIYLNRGFLTIGNLEVVPVYFTIGQLYAPFGRYMSLMLSTPITKSIGRINARLAEFGYTEYGFYGEVYAYDGDRTSGVDAVFKQGGINAGYQVELTKNSTIGFGVGAVTNMADSQGMQSNSLPFITDIQFGGFGNTPDGNDLVHNVPGIDGHIEYNYGPVTLIGEYIATTERFAPTDMTFNGVGATVSALHNEIDYTFHYHNHPISIGLVFEESWQALALNVPKYTYAIVVSSSIWKNTMVGVEYRHDINYHMTPLFSTTGAELPVPGVNIGGTRNFVIFQVGAYF